MGERAMAAELYVCAIINRWMSAAEDPSPAKANRPRMGVDYPHRISLADQVLSVHDDREDAVEAAIAAGGSAGLQFNIWSETGDESIAVRSPTTGPNAGKYEVVRFTLTIDEEGVREVKDVTGQLAEHIPPSPNQYMTAVVGVSSVIDGIENNPTYDVYTTDLFQPPSGFGAQPMNSPPAKYKPKDEPMTDQEKEDHKNYMQADGINPQIADLLMEIDDDDVSREQITGYVRNLQSDFD
jgi:hypothetical protein